MERHRFSDAATSQDAEGFAGQNPEADVVQHLVRPERLGNLFEFDIRYLAVGLTHSLAAFAFAESARCTRCRSSGVFTFKKKSDEKPSFSASKIVWGRERITSSILRLPALSAESTTPKNSFL